MTRFSRSKSRPRPEGRWREGWKLLKKEIKRLQEADAERKSKSVHRIRVTTRRLQALLDVVRETLGRKKSNRLKKELKTLRKMLATVRETDVHREIWKEVLSGHPYGRGIDRVIKERNRKALRDLGRSFDRKHWVKLAKKALAEPPSPPDTPILRKTGFLEVERDLDSMHDLRLKLKKLRYFLETTGDLRSDRPSRTMVLLKELQDELGGIHDRETFVAFLEKTVRRSRDLWDPCTRAGVEKSCEEIRQELDAAVSQWRRRWPQRRRALTGLVEKL